LKTKQKQTTTTRAALVVREVRGEGAQKQQQTEDEIEKKNGLKKPYFSPSVGGSSRVAN